MAQAIKTDGKAAGGKGGVVVALCVLTLLAAAGGGGLGIQLASTVEQVVTEKAKEKEEVEANKPPLRYTDPEMVMESLKPIVSNLGAPSSTFVRIEASIIFKNGTLANPQIAAAQIREDVMAYLRTLSLSQLEGPSGLIHLREDLNERARMRSEGNVQELVIETLVVQ
ncbi:flagellar basal body-associated FliL family protein [Ancylobacter radicis]|uniref:Flagellar protein FliL n=1 Tax=Ancylobacter radicis TaxID=2836179 RepID=A0ABS5RCD0_9HYPH|nr:flagellar basal body-associated FliL family protein [Ancylobacter radicis]MBS9479321.1 flagellar basal body-associated FliL family protein [Ancylobacter radicis]